MAGLAALGSGIRYALVHDGARPYATKDLVARVAEAAAKFGSAVPCIRPRDTIRTAERTLDRNSLYLVQTPQGFRRDVLMSAYEQAAQNGFAGTDDASYVEQLGIVPHLVEGEPGNLKITIPEDLPEQEDNEC
jgi:2-C-methyl-D-erythritol 4-phosphate cytidylyltransferase